MFQLHEAQRFHHAIPYLIPRHFVTRAMGNVLPNAPLRPKRIRLKTMPTLRCAAGTFILVRSDTGRSPPYRVASDCSRPVTSLNSVVFPQPLGPSRGQTILLPPATPCRTLPPKRFDTVFMVIFGIRRLNVIPMVRTRTSGASET
jgi:hypothetical protein